MHQRKCRHLRFRKLLIPDDLQEDLDNIKKLREGKIYNFSMEKRYFRKDGSIIWVNLTVSPMWKIGEKPNYHIAVVEDITKRKEIEKELAQHHQQLEKLVKERTAELTLANQQLRGEIAERKRAEEALLKQQYFLSKAQEIGKIGTWELDIKKNILVWTDENYRIFGLPIGTPLTYETFLNCVHPDDRKYVDKEWKAAFNKKPYDIEHRLLMSNGSIKWVREKAQLDFDEQGHCLRGTGFTQDITERKRAEEELSRREREFRTLTAFAPVGIFKTDVKGKCLYVNKRWCEISKLTSAEAAGHGWTKSSPP